MLPGPTLLYSCPSCAGLFSRRTIASGNTRGARYRSDGMMSARMLTQTPPLVACPHCQNSVCMLDLEHAIRFETYFFGGAFFTSTEKASLEKEKYEKAQNALAERYRDVPIYNLATTDQCLKYVQMSDLAEYSAITLRTYVWHRVNEERLAEGARPLTQVEVENLTKLLTLLGDEDEDALQRAEIFRELGLFDEATRCLRPNLTDHLAARAEQLMQAIERRDDQPFFFHPNIGTRT